MMNEYTARRFIRLDLLEARVSEAVAAERQRWVAGLREAAEGCRREGDTRYADFVESLIESMTIGEEP